MKKQVHIFLQAVAVFFAAALFSCARAEMEKEKALSRNDSLTGAETTGTLEEDFEADSLSPAQLQLFQRRAQQKVQDLIDYLQIVANKHYNAELRGIASGQVYELFADSSATIGVPLSQTQQGMRPLPQFLAELETAGYDSIVVKTDSLNIQPLLKSGENQVYTGSVSGRLSISGYTNGHITFSSTSVRTAKTITFKASKQFGTEQKSVWTTAIKEIR